VERRAQVEADASGAELAERTNSRLTLAGALSNGFGALIVAVFLALLAPAEVESGEYEGLLVRNGVVFAIYMAISLPLGRELVQRRPLMPIASWLRAGRPATDAERLLVLRYPLNWARGSAVFWMGAAALFSVSPTGARWACSSTEATLALLSSGRDRWLRRPVITLKGKSDTITL